MLIQGPIGIYRRYHIPRCKSPGIAIGNSETYSANATLPCSGLSSAMDLGDYKRGCGCIQGEGWGVVVSGHMLARRGGGKRWHLQYDTV